MFGATDQTQFGSELIRDAREDGTLKCILNLIGLNSPAVDFELQIDHFPPLFEEGRWERVLPAADFEAFDVRPSRSTLLAADAAGADVTRVGLPVWANALPLEVFVFVPVLADLSVEDADRDADFPVSFDFVMTGFLITS